MDIKLRIDTGIKDKNNKPIFVGDIIKVTISGALFSDELFKEIFVVKFKDFKIEPFCTLVENQSLGLKSEYEVLGNIYEKNQQRLITRER